MVILARFFLPLKLPVNLQDLGVIFLVGQNLAGFVSWTLDLLARVLTFAIFLII